MVDQLKTFFLNEWSPTTVVLRKITKKEKLQYKEQNRNEKPGGGTMRIFEGDIEDFFINLIFQPPMGNEIGINIT